MNNIINKIKNMSPDEIIYKIYNKCKSKIYYTFRKFIIIIRPININDIYFTNFTHSSRPLFEDEELIEYIEYLKENDKDKLILEQGEKIYNHIFDVLGSKSIYLGKSIEWNKDYKTNFIWENKFYKNIKIVDLNNNSDVKIPWELSRFQHLPTLALSYLINNDRKYIDEIQNQIEDWIEKNAVEMSVNWTCTMDVSIRACNWILMYYFLSATNELDSQFMTKFNKSLYLHGRYIKSNLENKYGFTTNHYISNIVGLIWIGIYFKNINYLNGKEAREWLEYGLSELENEMSIEVNSDGTDYEASTSYHCLVTEMFLYTTLLCKKNNINFSCEYMDKLERMVEFIMNITKPNGNIPLIGDMDSGRFVIISNYGSNEKRDFRHLLDIAGHLFNRQDFINYSIMNESILLMPGRTKKRTNRINLKSVSYIDGGYHILRNKDIYCIIRCGQHGTNGIGNHSHNDQLSFELNVNGNDFIIDPGMYIYTGDYKMRNLFRSTQMHNTVYIDNLEQNEFDNSNIFLLKDECKAKIISSGESYFEGEHFGYLNKIGVIHRRSIKLNDNKITIVDTLDSISNSKKSFIIFNLNYDLNCYVDRNNKYVTAKKDDTIIKIEVDKCNNIFIKDSYMSRQYGDSIRNKQIIIDSTGYKNIKTTITNNSIT